MISGRDSVDRASATTAATQLLDSTRSLGGCTVCHQRRRPGLRMGCRIHDRRCHRLLQSLRVPTNDFPDYPKFGVGPDAYYFTFDNFNITGSTDLGGNVCAADRTKMLAGTKATMQCSEQNAQQFARVPADLDGANPPAAGTPNFMMELDPDGSARFPPLRPMPHPTAWTMRSPAHLRKRLAGVSGRTDYVPPGIPKLWRSHDTSRQPLP